MPVVTGFIFSMQCDLEHLFPSFIIFLFRYSHPVGAQFSSTSPGASPFAYISFNEVLEKTISTQGLTSAVSLPMFCRM